MTRRRHRQRSVSFRRPGQYQSEFLQAGQYHHELLRTGQYPSGRCTRTHHKTPAPSPPAVSALSGSGTRPASPAAPASPHTESCRPAASGRIRQPRPKTLSRAAAVPPRIPPQKNDRDAPAERQEAPGCRRRPWIPSEARPEAALCPLPRCAAEDSTPADISAYNDVP